MDRQELYRQKLENLFKEWRAKIALLEEKAEHTRIDLRSEMVREIDDLKEKRKVVQDRWSELQRYSGDTWESMKERTEKAVAEMRSTLERALTRRK